MEIRILKQDELEIVKDLAYRIWPLTYGEIISKEQINRYTELASQKNIIWSK